MKTPHPATKEKMSFPFPFAKNGRIGKIYRLGNGNFKTHFKLRGEYRQNTFGSFDSALTFLDGEFSKLDTEQANNSQTLFPLNRSAKDYFELEQLLAEKGNGASLFDAVQFYIMNSGIKKLTPLTVSQCVEHFINNSVVNNDTSIHTRTLAKHFRRFQKQFGGRIIHDIKSQEITALRDFPWENNRLDGATRPKPRAARRGGVRGEQV